MILVTGGAGFIGANYVLQELGRMTSTLVNLDKLTYAGNLQTLKSISEKPNYHFYQGDIGDRALVAQILEKYQPEAVINFAAESHVDRSIHGPGDFIQTNIVGPFIYLNRFEPIMKNWVMVKRISFGSCTSQRMRSTAP